MKNGKHNGTGVSKRSLRRKYTADRQHQKEVDARFLWKQVEDVLMPRLRLPVIDHLVYMHLLRHSHLEGKRRLRFSILWLSRNINLPFSVADEFFFLGIHRDHRLPCARHLFTAALMYRNARRGPDVPPLFRLPVALQTVVEPCRSWRPCMADRMFVPIQLFRNRPRALTNPSQRRFRVAPCLMIDHLFQGIHQPRVRHRNEFAPGSGAVRPSTGAEPSSIHGCLWKSPCATVRTHGAPDSLPHSLKPSLRWPP